jgi:hypothetical protein
VQAFHTTRTLVAARLKDTAEGLAIGAEALMRIARTTS